MWIDDVIGWVNISNIKGQFSIETGFAKQRPLDTDFNTEFEAEAERMRTFLSSETS